MSIEKLFDMWWNDEILKYYVICAAVSALSWLSQFCTSKYRFRENSKFRHISNNVSIDMPTTLKSNFVTFRQRAINPKLKFNNYLWVCWFLGKILSNPQFENSTAHATIIDTMSHDLTDDHLVLHIYNLRCRKWVDFRSLFQCWKKRSRAFIHNVFDGSLLAMSHM